MPTENRSSNTEMVSVPRERLEFCLRRAEIFDDGADGADDESARSVADVLRILLAQPAAQHQGEPVAEIQWTDDLPEWQLKMLVEVACAPSTSIKLYTQADPGKVSAAIKTLQGMGYTYHGAELWKPPLGKAPNFDLIDTLLAQQAERDALQRSKSGRLIQLAAGLLGSPLRELQELLDEDRRMTRPRVDTAVEFADARLKDAAYELRKIADALSASAEPSAPVDQEGFTLIGQQLLEWNRSLPHPPILVGHEYGVATEAIRLARAALSGKP